MRDPFQSFDSAFEPLDETVTWRQDRSPHLVASFAANVMHGESQAENAGPSRDGFAADPWNVIVNRRVAMVNNIRSGDSITRLDGEILTVQQVSSDVALGWVIRCTANARAPK